MSKRMLIVLAGALAVAGCAGVSKLATEVAQDQGMIDQQQSDSINRTATAFEKSFQDLTPEQEHYIGRAVAATLLATYKPLDDAAANAYLNRLGQTLAMVGDRPETFGGYHFLLLDSDEINAFACPGGLILVTRGLMRCCGSEDALAAVLAHEIGHVQGKHGLRSIKSSRLTSALTILAAESARTFGSEEVAQLAGDLEGCVQDITQQLVVNGYSRDLEKEADADAVRITSRAGYNPRGLEAMLQELARRWKPGGPGFARTHPSPADRLKEIGPALAAVGPLTDPAPRAARFETALAGVL